MQPTSRGRLRQLRGGGWEESRQFSQPDASLPALPALAAAAADTLSRPPVSAGASKHPSLVTIEEIGRGLASESVALARSFRALANSPPSRKHPSLVPIEEVGRGIASEGAVSALLACAAPPRPPLTRWSMATAVRNRHRVGRATRISFRKPRNPPRNPPHDGGRRNPHGMHSSLAIVTELGGK